MMLQYFSDEAFHQKNTYNNDFLKYPHDTLKQGLQHLLGMVSREKCRQYHKVQCVMRIPQEISFLHMWFKKPDL